MKLPPLKVPDYEMSGEDLFRLQLQAYIGKDPEALAICKYLDEVTAIRAEAARKAWGHPKPQVADNVIPFGSKTVPTQEQS